MRSVHKFCPIAHHLGSNRSQVRKHCFQAQAGLIANDAPHVQRLPLSYSLYLPNQHSQIQSSEAPVNVANTSPIPGSAPTSTATGTSSAQASRALHQSAANARHVPSRPLSFLTHLPTPPATLNHTRKSPTPPRRQRSHPKLPQITTLKSSPPPGRGSLLVTLRKLERSVAGLTLDDGDARAALVLTLCRRYRSQLARGFSPSSSSVFSANTWPLEQPPRRRSLSSSTPTPSYVEPPPPAYASLSAATWEGGSVSSAAPLKLPGFMVVDGGTGTLSGPVYQTWASGKRPSITWAPRSAGWVSAVQDMDDVLFGPA